MSEIKDGYHKLKDTEHLASVLETGLRPSTPASIHWLGEGVYFFLNPNGYKWAIKWPMNSLKQRTNSKDGILLASLDLSNALDLADNTVRKAVQQLVTTIKLKLCMEDRLTPPIRDGSIFAALFRYGMLGHVVDLVPTAIIANFDETYKQYRINDSKVFMLDGTELEIAEDTAQLQACIINTSVIKELTVVP